MMKWRIGACVAALLLVSGGLTRSAPVRAESGYTPCSIVSIAETETLLGTKVVKSLEHGSVCQRWLAGGSILLLAVGTPIIRPWETETVIQEMGGTWVSRQFGEITCRTVVVTSDRRLSNTTCVAEREPVFYGDGFDHATVTARGPVSVTLQVTAGAHGVVPIDHVRVLAERVLARL